MQTQTDSEETKSIDQHFYFTIHNSNSFNNTISTNEKDIQQLLQLRGIGEAADTMVFYGYNIALIFFIWVSAQLFFPSLPWCAPFLASGLECVPGLQQYRSPLLLSRKQNNKQQFSVCPTFLNTIYLHKLYKFPSCADL